MPEKVSPTSGWTCEEFNWILIINYCFIELNRNSTCWRIVVGSIFLIIYFLLYSFIIISQVLYTVINLCGRMQHLEWLKSAFYYTDRFGITRCIDLSLSVRWFILFSYVQLTHRKFWDEKVPIRFTFFQIRKSLSIIGYPKKIRNAESQGLVVLVISPCKLVPSDMYMTKKV